MRTTIINNTKGDLSMFLDCGLTESRHSSTRTMSPKTPGGSGTRCERFQYRGLTLPPKIWSRVYDAFGHLIEENLSESDGSLVFRWTYVLDERGRRVQGNLCNGKDILLAVWFYNDREEPTRKLNLNGPALIAA